MPCIDLKITQGSNSRIEKSALIERLRRLLTQTLGEPIYAVSICEQSSRTLLRCRSC